MRLWRVEMLVWASYGKRPTMKWVGSRVNSDQEAFLAMMNHLSDREMVRHGYMRGARLLAPGGIVAVEERATFIAYKTGNETIDWSKVKIVGES